LSITNEPKESKLKRIFKNTVMFACIGTAAIISFIIPNRIDTQNTWADPYHLVDNSLELPFLIIIVGLVIERIHYYFKIKKKR